MTNVSTGLKYFALNIWSMRKTTFSNNISRAKPIHTRSEQEALRLYRIWKNIATKLKNTCSQKSECPRLSNRTAGEPHLRHSGGLFPNLQQVHCAVAEIE